MLLPASSVVMWSLRAEWGEQRGKSAESPWVDNLGFQEARVCAAVALLENLAQAAAHTKPTVTHSNLSGNSVLSLKRKAVTLSSSQGTDASGSPDRSVLAFWFFHCTPPSSVQGRLSQDLRM